MSNDHIFAAQMWSWADPMIKRDSHGRILVVNAAFLQLYGGNVESWTGNPIQGWPLPKNPGESSRFESRIPMPTGGETVYDWMECTHQDGTAVAMARDVSAYAAAAKAPPAPVTAQPAIQPVETTAPMSQAELQNDLAGLSPLANTVAEPEPVPQAAAPVQEEAPAQAPIQSPAPVATAAVAVASAAVAASQLTTPAAQAAPTPVQAPVQAAQVAEQTPVTPAPSLAAETDTRAYEKRALPIEDGDAILGNNWRDAVIAKAVGVEDSEEMADVASAQSNTMSNSDGQQIKVLLAEDNAINALLTRTLLEAEGCHCDVVEDGALAVEAVKNNGYDLVFMDMRMPNMDGLEATRKIRAMGHNPKALPIVALTANAFDDDRNACFDSGMNDFMTKPVSAEELSAMVKTHTSLDIEKMAS